MVCNAILKSKSVFGELESYQGPDEDSPVFFKNEDFMSHLERLVQESNAQQFMDFYDASSQYSDRFADCFCG